jgi:hypothetical protein
MVIDAWEREKWALGKKGVNEGREGGREVVV